LLWWCSVLAVVPQNLSPIKNIRLGRLKHLRKRPSHIRMLCWFASTKANYKGGHCPKSIVLTAKQLLSAVTRGLGRWGSRLTFTEKWNPFPRTGRQMSDTSSICFLITTQLSQSVLIQEKIGHTSRSSSVRYVPYPIDLRCISGIESCRRRGLDPYAYLREVLTRLPHIATAKSPKSHPKLGTKCNCRCNGSHHKRRSITSLALTTPAVALVNRCLA
jgi:hypothetical protein